MYKLPDWEARFYPAIEKVRNKPFEWGEHDCALFAANMIQVITGEDVAAEFRGKYNSLKSSLKALKNAGYESLESFMDDRFETVHKYQSTRGNPVLIEIKGKQFLGVNVGTIALSPGKNGLMHIDMQHWLKGWRVING